MPKTSLFYSRSYTPRDQLVYQIPYQAIKDTERILKEYGDNEGLVYWGGKKEGYNITVMAVIAPDTESSAGRVFVSHDANSDFVETLCKDNLIEVAQVHTHPSDWVGHSLGDDQMAAFKTEGLLSIVVAEYCRHGMLPIVNCGIHRFIKRKFKRLSNNYVEKHFQLMDKLDSGFEDQRK
jgi:hypothetical protein